MELLPTSKPCSKTTMPSSPPSPLAAQLAESAGGVAVIAERTAPTPAPIVAIISLPPAFNTLFTLHRIRLRNADPATLEGPSALCV